MFYQPLSQMTLMLAEIEGKRRSGQQRMRWSDSIINLMDINLSKLQEIASSVASLLGRRGGSRAQSRGKPCLHGAKWASVRQSSSSAQSPDLAEFLARGCSAEG